MHTRVIIMSRSSDNNNILARVQARIQSMCTLFIIKIIYIYERYM